MSEPERDDPTEAPAFKKLVRRFLDTPPKPQEELKLGRGRQKGSLTKGDVAERGRSLKLPCFPKIEEI